MRFVRSAVLVVACALAGGASLAGAAMVGVLAGEGTPAILRIDEVTGAGTLIATAPTSLAGVGFTSRGRLFVTTGAGSSNLLECNPVTGAVISTKPILAGNNDGGIADIAFQPGTDVLFGVTSNFGSRYGLPPGSAGTLVTIDLATGALTVIGRDAQLGDELGGIAFAPDGTLYFVRGQNTVGVLHQLDPATAAILSTTPLSPAVGFVGLAVRPRDGLLFASGSPAFGQKDVIYTIDAASGAVTEVGPAGSPIKVHDLAFQPETSATPVFGPGALVAAALLMGAAGALRLRSLRQ